MSAPRMPSGFRKAEQLAWRAVIAELGGTGQLAPSDGPLLRSMALLTARLEDIRAELAFRQQVEGDDGRGYLWAETARGGWTSNPLIGQERETIKELRLLHERLERILAGRGSTRSAGPKSLAEMRSSLTAVKGGRAKAKTG